MVDRIHFPVLVEPEGSGFLLAVGERLVLEATYSPMPRGLPQHGRLLHQAKMDSL